MEFQFPPIIPPGSRSPILPAGHTGLAGFSRSFTYHRLLPSSSTASAQHRADLPWEVSGRECSILAPLWKLLCHPDTGTQDLEVPGVGRGVRGSSSLPPSLPHRLREAGVGWCSLASKTLFLRYFTGRETWTIGCTYLLTQSCDRWCRNPNVTRAVTLHRVTGVVGPMTAVIFLELCLAQR